MVVRRRPDPDVADWQLRTALLRAERRSFLPQVARRQSVSMWHESMPKLPSAGPVIGDVSCRCPCVLTFRTLEGGSQGEVAVQERGDDALLLLGTDTRGVVVIEAEDVGVAAPEQGVEPGRSVRSRDVRIEVADRSRHGAPREVAVVVGQRGRDRDVRGGAELRTRRDGVLLGEGVL